jgi:O-antigen ligase
VITTIRQDEHNTVGTVVAAGAMLVAALTGVLAAYSLKLAAAAVVGLIAVLAAVFRPVLVVLILFLTVYPSTLSLDGVSIQRLGGPLALLLAVTQLVRGGVHFRRPTLTLALVMAYAGLAAASLSWSNSTSGTLDALASLGISLAYMAAVALVLRDSEELRPIVWAVTLWSAALGAWWIFSYVRGQSREFNALGDPNFFAALQVIAAPLAIALIANTSGRRARIVLYAALILIAGSIPASLSRGGMVALLVVGLVIAFIPSVYLFSSSAHKRTFFVAVAAMSLALFAVAGATLSQRFEQTLNDPSGAAGRGDLALAAFHGFHDHPLLGMGFGAFAPNSFQLLRTSPGVFLDLHLRCLAQGSAVRASGSFCQGQPVHDTYLESLVELGVPGLLLFSGLLLVTGWSLIRTARLARVANDPFTASIATALVVGLLGFALVSATLSTETNRTPWMIVALSLALPGMVGPARLWTTRESGS